MNISLRVAPQSNIVLNVVYCGTNIINDDDTRNAYIHDKFIIQI